MDFKLLSKYKISYLECETVRTLVAAQNAAKKIGFPIALKIISPQALHKTDFGGVVLGIKNAQELQNAYTEMMKRFSGAGMKIDGVLVQKMAGASTHTSTQDGAKGAQNNAPVELIVGGKRDSQFGQMIMLGVGGIYVEILRDFTFRICPITAEDANEMILELQAYPLLAGARKRKPINQAALVSTLLKVSALLEKENPKEFDINPLIVDDKGCIAVDVRLIK